MTRIGMMVAAALLVGVSAMGQTQPRLDSQARCAPTATPVILLANVPVAAGAMPISVCALLDGASFTVDTTTNPPTLRLIFPAAPTPSVPTFADAVSPAGTINGANATFTLPQAPSPAASLQLCRNGLQLQQGLDYTLSGATITFNATLPNGSAVPLAGDVLVASYRY